MNLYRRLNDNDMCLKKIFYDKYTYYIAEDIML